MSTPRRGETVPPRSPPRLPGPVLLQQTLRDMLFVHWPLAPEAVHHLFPAGTRPDTFDGETFVGVVGFAVPSTRMGGVAGVGSMNQLNLRLYSVDDDGRQGVVFLSMDVTRPDMVLAARLLPRLPYRWSQLERTRRGPAVTGFQLRRRFPSRLVARVEADIDEAVEHPSDLEVFLTSRWGLHTRTMLGTTWIPIGHAPFPLHRARVRHVDDVLLSAAGVPKAAEDPMGVLWSPGLSAQIGRPTLLDKAHDRLAGNRLG